MNRRVWWVWLIPIILLLLGIMGAIVWQLSGQPNPVLYLRTSASNLFLFLGAGLGLIVAIVLLFWLMKTNETRLLKEQSEQAAADRRRFIQRLDHELKNPLTAIRASIANYKVASNTEMRESAITTIESQAIRLSRLTADLRKIAELENRSLDFAPVDMNQLLPEVMELAQEKSEAATRQLNLSLPQAPRPLPQIMGDWDLLFLALYNLLDNALKFSQPGDTIEVRGREEGREIVLEIADTGPGVAENDLPHVWEELYRGRLVRDISGSGLGLALVRAIVVKHGGLVLMTSQENLGTLVVMRLPIT